MIFSFSSQNDYSSIEFPFDGDIFCFFPVKGAALCPEELGLNCLLSTLRLKRPVLILNTPLQVVPKIDTSKRWDLGQDWIWIAPRGHSHFADNYPQLSLSFVLIKIFLVTPK